MIGLKFLHSTFGKIPKVAMNIDNFGHSAAFASLLSQMGYTANIIARLSLDDIKEKSKN